MVLTWHFGVGLAQLPDFSGDGVSVTLIMLVATPVQLALLMLMARQTGAGAADYLGLIRPRRADVVMGIVAIVAFILVGNAVSWLLGQNIVTGFQRDIYRSAGAAGMLPLLWLVVVVVTPVNEELLFRGFLFRGWHRTPRDAWIVIIVTALLWAIIHVQYDLYVIGQVFVLRPDFGLVPLGDRLDFVDHPDARPGQCRRHAGDLAHRAQLTRA